jgi:hypothetical protein
MKRSEEEKFLYALAAYLGASLLATVLLLLGSLAAMKGIFFLAKASLGARTVYWAKPLLYDSVGFALASAGTALVQYYLVSLLRLTVNDRLLETVLAAFAALFCGLLFWRGAMSSILGTYAFSGLCVTLAALLGSFEAIYQKPAENPWPASVSSFLK